MDLSDDGGEQEGGEAGVAPHQWPNPKQPNKTVLFWTKNVIILIKTTRNSLKIAKKMILIGLSAKSTFLLKRTGWRFLTCILSGCVGRLQTPLDQFFPDSFQPSYMLLVNAALRRSNTQAGHQKWWEEKHSQMNKGCSTLQNPTLSHLLLNIFPGKDIFKLNKMSLVDEKMSIFLQRKPVIRFHCAMKYLKKVFFLSLADCFLS